MNYTFALLIIAAGTYGLRWAYRTFFHPMHGILMKKSINEVLGHKSKWNRIPKWETRAEYWDYFRNT
ncbi:MAG: hypothetical protein EBX40_02125 [Gammaproteobacteria bacterium]|nr:hypothetical protein [Gammaproteobacteria bacterium]